MKNILVSIIICLLAMPAWASDQSFFYIKDKANGICFAVYESNIHSRGVSMFQVDCHQVKNIPEVWIAPPSRAEFKK